MKAKFITLEGGEGAGKSTQLKLLAARLQATGLDVVTTREPGGTPDADALRSLLVNGEPNRWSPAAEALLNYAARDSHLTHVIRPALAAGRTVLCDRFADSTRAYQAMAGGIGPDLIEAIDLQIVGETQPDLTLIFDLDPAAGLERARQRGGADRFEKKGLAFHEALRGAFLQVAHDFPERCRVIDASLPVDEVAEVIWTIVAPQLAEQGT